MERQVIQSVGFRNTVKDGVVTGQSTYEIGYGHMVQCRSGGIGKAGHGVENHKILGIVVREHAFPENFAKTDIKVGKLIPVDHYIAVATTGGKLLHQSELLDITGKCCLSAFDAALHKSFHHLILGFNILLGDEFEDHGLSGTFHIYASFLPCSRPVA